MPNDEIVWNTRISPQRLTGWIARFSASHGAITSTLDFLDNSTEGSTPANPALVLHAADGALARLHSDWGSWINDDLLAAEPFEPVDLASGNTEAASTSISADQLIEEFISCQLSKRRIGIILARKARHSIAVADGEQLMVHRSETNYIQGRTKKGGQSQQRYARRRDNQAAKAYKKASQDSFELLLPDVKHLEALVVAGDRFAIDAILEDPRLAPLALLPRRTGPSDISTPNFEALSYTARWVRQIRVGLNQQARITSGR